MSSATNRKERVTPAVSLATEELGEEILCSHCRRTATNGIKCKGICVADSDY
ncbi:MAG: hypothetical protein ACKN9E_17180 [Microcystaceae cyanobacterium]|nr:hypothetical protein [Merismopediaceae bacterium]